MPSPGGVPQGAVASSDGRPGIECAADLDWHPELGCVHESANLQLLHQDRMSDSFVLMGAEYTLDGRGVARFDAPPADEPGHKDIPVARMRVAPGEHELAVSFHYRGHGRGVFSYMSGYKFEVASKYTFRVGKLPQKLFVVGGEKGGPTSPLEKRPEVRFQLEDL